MVNKDGEMYKATRFVKKSDKIYSIIKGEKYL